MPFMTFFSPPRADIVSSLVMRVYEATLRLINAGFTSQHFASKL